MIWHNVLSFTITSATDGIINFAKNIRHRNSGEAKRGLCEEETLEMKYAAGTISKQKYEKEKRDLSHDIMSTPYPAIRLRRVL